MKNAKFPVLKQSEKQGSLADQINQYTQLSERIKDLEADRAKLRAALLEAAGDEKRIEDGGVFFQWWEAERETLDTKAAIEKYGRVALRGMLKKTSYVSTKTGRVAGTKE